MPYLGSTIFVASLVVGLALGMMGFFLLARAVWGPHVERARQSWVETPVKTVLVGLLTSGFALLVCGTLLSIEAGPVKLAGMLITGLTVGFALTGTAGLAGAIGGRLSSPADEGRQWLPVLRGGVILELSFLLPVLGWFVILPLAVVGGAGSAILALQRKKAAVGSHRATTVTPHRVSHSQVYPQPPAASRTPRVMTPRV